MKDVLVVIGPGSIGQAIARRVGTGRTILLADQKPEQAAAAARVMTDAGFEVVTATANMARREDIEALVEKAVALGPVTGLVVAAGVSPVQGDAATVLAVNLYGTALVLEAFGKVIARGGVATVIASMAGHRLPALSAEEDEALATAPVESLLALPLLQPQNVRDSGHAYMLAKRANALRVRAQATPWGRRGARVNAISPGIIITPLANEEMKGPRGPGYRAMLERSPAGRPGTPDEVAALAGFLMGPEGAFVTGSDFLIDGGVTASYWYGDLAPTAAGR